MIRPRLLSILGSSLILVAACAQPAAPTAVPTAAPSPAPAVAARKEIGYVRAPRAYLVAMQEAVKKNDVPAARAAFKTYDGVWNVVFATRAGNCSSTNSVPFAVSGGRVSSAGGGRVTGGVGRGGYVAVTISVDASVASGTGRLAGGYGGGRWSGIIQGDRCSGIWQAMRG